MDELAERYLALPCPVGRQEHFEAWRAWTGGVLEQRRYGLLLGEEQEPDERRLLAWRACLAHWQGTGGSISPEGTTAAAEEFFRQAHAVPAYVYQAARRLTAHLVLLGSTSVDVMYLVAAFAWPLAEMDTSFAREAWACLVHAPWQTDMAACIDLCCKVATSGAHRSPRLLVELALERKQAGLRASARELLEAIVCAWAELKSIELIAAPDDLDGKLAMEGAIHALHELAREYQSDEQITQIHAKILLQRAAGKGPVRAPANLRIPWKRAAYPGGQELPRPPEAEIFDSCASQRVWDRPFAECYELVGEWKTPAQLEDEISRALRAGQLPHARRLAEATLVRHVRSWSPQEVLRAAHEKLAGVLERLPRAPLPEQPLVRCALEHLITLYLRSNYRTQHARTLLEYAYQQPRLCGQGAPLAVHRTSIESFVNESDLYQLLRRQDRVFQDARARLGDKVRSLWDLCQSWLHERLTGSGPNTNATIAALTAPFSEASTWIKGLNPATERTLAGLLVGAQERTAPNEMAPQPPPQALDVARAFDLARTQELAAAHRAISPGLSPGEAQSADLGSTFQEAIRRVHAIGRCFGLAPESERGRRLLDDALAAGLGQGEGMLGYLSGILPKETSPLRLGAVDYAEEHALGHLWSSSAQPRLQATQNLARLCAITLTQARRIQVDQRISLQGISPQELLRRTGEAAIQLCLREALLAQAAQASQA